MKIHASTSIEELTDKLLNDVLDKSNFEDASSGKGSFLTGGSVIVCERRGLQEYIQKKCADKHGIWTALSFKTLAGLLMRCAFDLSDVKKDEKENPFNQHNLVWSIYRLLEEDKKYFQFANELASLFMAYQIYRPEIIEKWNKGKTYTIQNADNNLINNEKFQRELWIKLRNEYKDEQDISQLYKLLKTSKKELPYRQIFIFAPISIAPVQLEALNCLSETGCRINMYIHQISDMYIGDSRSEKYIAKLRKAAWENNKIVDENNLYWDLGNSLVANLGRSAQVLYEQIGWENLENTAADIQSKEDSLLHEIQSKITSDNNEKTKRKADNSVIINSCFSPLREIEVLCDHLLDIFAEDESITPEDIAVVAPDIEIYANAIESVFIRYDIPYAIADRDVKKHDKTVRLLNMLFSIQNSDYEAPDIASLFEYSLYVQGKELESNDIERLEKWIKENAIRHGIEGLTGEVPDYSLKTGLDQLLAGFFIISENGFSEGNDYCYPDIEDGNLDLTAEFILFTEALKNFEEKSKNEKSINDWDNFFRESLRYFFGEDKLDFNEENENPYQKVIKAWDSLKKEMIIGFGNDSYKINFLVLKTALSNKLEENSKINYTMSGKVSFSCIETLSSVPRKVFCCIGMNGKEYPRQVMFREISLLNNYLLGDKDTANEDRLMFLEMIKNAKDKLYISWIGQNENTAEELDPSGVVILLLKNLEEQYEINNEDIIKKYPLQPFSRKYNACEFTTYDNRWNFNNKAREFSGIWHWRIDNNDDAEKIENYNVDKLYRILSNAPRYFIRDICNISLPEDLELLEGLEPLAIETALDKWELRDMIINEKILESINNKIIIQQRRGELPAGVFARRNINEIISNTNRLIDLAKNEKEGTYWIYPSSDKGKYRLKHWLNHLEKNMIYENTNTKMFLRKDDDKNIILKLPGIGKEKAKELLDNICKIKKELDTRLIPVFPDAAWIYISKRNIEKANEAIFDYASNYTKMAFGDNEVLEGSLEKEFIEYSNILFNGYIDDTEEVKK